LGKKVTQAKLPKEKRNWGCQLSLGIEIHFLEDIMLGIVIYYYYYLKLQWMNAPL
jgi:hypothetical protein